LGAVSINFSRCRFKQPLERPSTATQAL
jgi:hypothetical protein